MKKNILPIALSIIMILGFGFGTFFLFYERPKIYENAQDLTATLSADLPLNKVAEAYVDSCVTVYTSVGAGASIGSGVCIASKNYKTQSGYIAKKGSYIATNYHVINFAVDEEYKSYQPKVYIIKNGEEQLLPAKVLWASEDMDVAVLYCDTEDNLDWIQMEDRTVKSTNKIGFDSIFTLGTPLGEIQYQNTYSEGRVTNLNFNISEPLLETLYIYNSALSGGKQKYTTDKNAVTSASSAKAYNVIRNVYENVVMMNVDITNGNSGGGVFDEKGKLIGLSTLGVSGIGSMPINFFTPIYPIMQVLDKLIVNNETSASSGVFSPESMGIKVIDGNEVSWLKTEIDTNDDGILDREVGKVYFDGGYKYYFDGTMYSATNSAFSFEDKGVYVMTNEGDYQFKTNYVITSVDKNDLNSVTINTRNDLLYFLLTCNDGETININGYDALTHSQKSYTIEL